MRAHAADLSPDKAVNIPCRCHDWGSRMQIPFMIDESSSSPIFSTAIFCFIFGLVKPADQESTPSSFAETVPSLPFPDRFAIDRLGSLFGIAYPPSVLALMTTGFTFLLLIT
jgi:hypothetical protein